MTDEKSSPECGVCGSLIVTYRGEDPHCEDCGYPDALWGSYVSSWWEMSTWFEEWEVPDGELLPVDPLDLVKGLLYIGVIQPGDDKKITVPILLTVKDGIFYRVAQDDAYVKLKDQKSINFVMAFVPAKWKYNE